MAERPLSPLERVLSESPSMGLPSFQPTERRPSAGAASPTELMPVFEDTARKYDVPVNVLLALGEQESGFNPRAVGQQTKWGTAKGLMQYLDSTAQGMGINPYDPVQSIDAAARQIRERLDKGYSMEDAVKEHFAGPDRRQWGAKTARYGQEVLQKAGRWAEQFQARQPAAQPDLQAQLDAEEPGRYKVLTPKEAESYQRRADLMNGGNPAELTAMPKAQQPSPLIPGTQTPQQAPSPLTIENQRRVEAGAQPKDTRPYQSFTEATGAALSNVPERFQQSIAGLFQMAGEDMGQFRERDIARGAAARGITPGDMKLLAWAGNNGLVDPKSDYREALSYIKQNIAQSLNEQQLKELDAAGIINPAEISAFAKDWREQTQKTMAEVRPEPESMAYYGSAAISSLAEMGPMLAAAIVTRNPKIATAVMGGQVGGQAYATGREKGLSEDEAQNYALLTAAAEAAPEALVLGKLLKPGAGIMKKALEGTVLEGAQEAVTAALQAGIDKGYISPDMTLREALVQVRDGAIIGAMVGGGMGGAIGTAERVSRPSERQQVEREINQSINNWDGDLASVPSATPAAEPAPATPQAEAAPAQAAPVEAAPVQQPAPQPAPSGPLGRAMQNAMPGRSEESAADGPRVTLSAEGLEPISGAVIRETPESLMIRGDDGQSYEVTREEIASGAAVVRPEGADVADPQQIRPEPKADTQAQIDALSDPTSGKDAALITLNSEQPPTIPEGLTAIETSQGLFITNNPEKAAAVEQRGGQLSTDEVGALLDYTTPKAQTDGTVVQARDAAGNVVTEEATNQQNLAQAVANAENQAPEGGRVNVTNGDAVLQERAARVEQERKTYDQMDEVELRERLKYLGGQARNSGGWNKALMQERRKVEQAIEALKKPADQVAVKDEAPAAPELKTEQPTHDQAPVKWFGSREKADAFIAKKKMAGTHEVVEAGRSRFEIREKAQQPKANEQSAASLPTNRTQAAEAGAAAFAAGEKRLPPAMKPGLQEAWLKAWDKANASAPVKADPKADMARAMAMTEDQYIAAVNPAGERISSEDRVILKAGDIDLPAGSQQVSTFRDKKGRSVRVLRADDGSMYAKSGDTVLGFVGPFEDGKTVVDVIESEQGNGVGRGLMTAYIRENPMAQSGGFSEAGERTRRAVFRDLKAEQQGAAPSVAEAQTEVPKSERQKGSRKERAEQLVGKVGDTVTPSKAFDYLTAGKPMVVESIDSKGGVYLRDPVTGSGTQINSLVAERQGVTFAKQEKAADPKPVTTKKVGDGIAATVIDPSAMRKPAPEPSRPDLTDLTEPSITRRASPGNMSDQSFVARAFVRNGDVPVMGEGSTEADALAELRKDADRKKADTKPAVSENKIFTEDAAERARALLRSKLTQLNSGIDPEIMQAGITLAGYHIEKGARTFAAYAKAMVGDLGDVVRPYLKSWYMGVKYDPRATGFDGMSSAAEVEAFDLAQLEETPNEPAALDQPGQGALERAPAEPVQGTEGQEPTRQRTEAGGRADARGNERTGSQRDDDARGLGSDEATVPVPAAGDARGGRGGERGAVQRGDGSDAAGRAGSVTPSNGVTAEQRAANYTITDADQIGAGGAKTKYKNNLAAIRLLKQLEQEGRPATRDEQSVLAKYVGWGGLPQAFERSDSSASKGWEKEVAELKGLLTPEEYSAAASSSKNAHYTAPEIVRVMWDAVTRLGFNGGKVLEPSVGTGNFFGLMPHELRKSSALNGVELDRITSGIAAQLYPEAKIARMGYQDYLIPDGYFDLAIGNPPFGRESLYDGKRKDLNGFSIHNYFFAKSLDGLRPGGVLAMVVTNRMLDVPGDKARRYMADRADFIGAIRLPNDAFMANAGTSVTTDIIFMRKRAEGEKPAGESWMEVRDYADKDGNTVPLNEYFVRNPDMMLGDFGAYGSMYREGEPALVAREGQSLPDEIAKAVARLPRDVMTASKVAKPETRATVRAESVRVGSMFLDGDTVRVRGEDVLGENTAEAVTFPNDKARDRVVGMIGIRDALARVRGMQLDSKATDKQIEAARKTLNQAYDSFVKDNGPINLDANKRLFRDDPTWPQLAALEDSFDKGVSAAVAKKTGEEPRKPSAQKAAIFSKRTQQPYQAPTTAASANDALVASLAETGRVDLQLMSDLYGKAPETIVKELGELVYQDPVKGYVTRDEYLSGNVKAKLAQAKAAAQQDAAYARNVEALEAVQPADIEAVDINVKPGAPWVPAAVMGEFANHIAEGSRSRAVYNPASAKWSFLNVDASPAASQRFATSRVALAGVLEAAANQKVLQVYDQHTDGTRTLNESETQLANDKVNAVKDEWGRWIWADDARRESLSRLYNDTYNTNVSREYDGAHLTFPGKVGDDIINLRPHQANAVWRIVQNDTTLLDHVVGAGKTFTMVAGAMELRRMGYAKKPMFVVPNHLVSQWAADFTKLYPGANVLAATKKDFEKENRKRLFARIATGDWDAVIVAHSSFGKVEVEPKEQAAFIEEQIADLDGSIELMRQTDGKDSRNVKDTQKRRDALREKLKKLLDADNKDDSLYWGELGVDALFVDEAHEFKNLAFSTSMNRVAGLGTQTGSQKAADLFLKVRQVLNATGGRNIVFATGTPISNTMAEMFTMQRYLDYSNLKGQGLSHFDAWARMFGEVVTDWELSPSGKYKMNSRFAKFVNMPELMQRYGSFADVVNRADINRMLAAQGKKLPVPKVRGGKPENVIVPRSQDQANYIGEPIKDEDGNETDQYPRGSLVWRSENLPKKAEKGADNMLKIMGDARKAALDMRLIDPSYPDNPNSKVNVAADRMADLYQRWNAERGTQLVFIDLSTPKNAKAAEAERLRDLVRRAEEGDEAASAELDKVSPDELMALDGDFSVYDDLKQKLIDRGVPAEEISFIHDAKTDLQKDELFGKVRSGRVRFLFGSTAKMGAGTNVQDRLVALHHLDAPWRPSDLEQREGRIIRQGNKLYDQDPEGFEVGIYRYATKQTLDSRMWQTIEGKANFIEQVRKGAAGTREVEDVAGEAANAAEMKAAASGNPLILEEMSLRQKIRKLENERSNHDREQFRLRDSIRMAQRRIESADRLLTDLREDAKREVPKDFAMTINGRAFDKRKDAGEAILAQAASMEANGVQEAEVGQYGGFTLRLERLSKERFEATLNGAGSYDIAFELGSDPLGLTMRITNMVKDLGGAVEQVERDKARAEKDIPRLEEQASDWSKGDDLAQARERYSRVIDELKPKKKEAKPEEVKASLSGDTATVDGERFSLRQDGMDGLMASSPINLRTPDDLKGLPLSEAREKAYQTMLDRRGGIVEHPVVGKIELNRNGLSKSRSSANDPLKVAILTQLRDIAPGAHYLGQRSDGDATYHYLGRRVRVDGTPATVLMTLREKDGKIAYYNHTMLNDVLEPANDNYIRPSLQVDRMSMAAPASAERVREVLTAGPLGKHLAKMIDAGRLVIHEDAGTVPGVGLPGMQAKTTEDGVVHMVANNVTEQNAQAVLLHEMFHSGARPLVGTRKWAQLLVRLEALYKQYERSNGNARDFFNAARRRVDSANAQMTAAGQPMSDLLTAEEFGAYAIEAYESAPGAVRRWVDDVVGAIKDYLFRTFGIQLGNVTPAQLRAMAVAAVRNQVVSGQSRQETFSLQDQPNNAPSDAEIDGWFSRKLTDAMAGPKSQGRWSILSTAPLDRMVEELAGDNQPAQEYLNLKRDMDAFRSQKHQAFDDIAQNWLKLNVTNRQAAADMAALMHEATIAQVDPAEPFKSSITKADEQVMAYQPNSEAGEAAFAKKAADEKRREDHKRLAVQFRALPSELQALYRQVRDSYKEMSAELDDILAANLGMALDIAGRQAERRYTKEMEQIRDDGLTGEERKEAEAQALKKYNTAMSKQRWNKRARMTELRQQLESNRLDGPYFPLARFGDYFVTVRDRETGEVISFSRFESATEQQRFAKQAQRDGNVQTGLLSNDSDVRGSVDPRFVTDVENILAGAEVPDAVKDQVWQRYLESMPDMSVRKGFIHRKNRAGYSADALRAFASRMFHGAHQLGRLKYGAQMQEQLDLARDVARDSANPERNGAVINELNRRNEFVMNPKGGALAQHITSAAFVYQLSMSPAAALVNLTQTAIVGVPVIGAKFGAANTVVELNRALGHFVSGRGRAENSSRLTDDEKAAMRAAYAAGIVDSSQAHNLAGVGETGVQYSALRNRVMGVVAWQFHQAERLNREVTFLAAYRLAKKDGASHEQAIDQAGRLTYKTHFDYQASNRPRVMQGDVAKVALVFRNFQVNMLWRLFRDTHQAFAGDKAARKEAVMQLAGITGMMAMSAGVRGVWLYGLAIAFASMLFGDDAEEQFKKGTIELLGPTAAGFLLNGIPGHTLGISLSERIGMPDLWFRSPDRQLEGQDEFNYWQSQILGAVPGIMSNMWRGWNMVLDGKVYRGVETMAPKFVRDLMRAGRFADEGVQTLRGDPLVEDLKPGEIAAQMLGFTPAVVAEQYERNSALKNAEKRIMDERRRLMDRYATAYKLKDEAQKMAVRKEMKAFNEKNREVAITSDAITRSIMSRRRFSERTEGGVALNPRLDRRLRDSIGDAIYR